MLNFFENRVNITQVQFFKRESLWAITLIVKFAHILFPNIRSFYYGQQKTYSN